MKIVPRRNHARHISNEVLQPVTPVVERGKDAGLPHAGIGLRLFSRSSGSRSDPDVWPLPGFGTTVILVE